MNDYVYIVSGITIVIVGIFVMYHFATSQSYNSSAQFDNETQNCVDEQNARKLAENSVGSAISSSGYSFDDILCIWGTGDDRSELKAVRVTYQSPSAGARIITEDSKLTKVINVTVTPWIGSLTLDDLNIRDNIKIKMNDISFVVNEFGTFQIDAPIKESDRMLINDQTLIPWARGYLLKWSDFTTVQQHDYSEVAYANTDIKYNAIIEVNNINSDCKFTIKKVQVEAVFKPSSWVAREFLNESEQKKAYVLKHEQGHFDISEEYARKMYHDMNSEVRGKIYTCDDKNLNEQDGDAHNKANSVLKVVYDRLLISWNALDAKYDKDTNHDKNFPAQNEYNLLFTNFH